MKKIFILTGEASGDKLASKVISELNKLNSNIEYLSVGGENLKSIGIKSIYDVKEICEPKRLSLSKFSKWATKVNSLLLIP